MLIFRRYSVQGRALGEERGECGIGCARVVLSNCVVEGEVEEGVKFGFDFFGDFWAFVCFMGRCAEWGIAEGQSGDLFLRAAFALFFCWRCSFRAFFVGLWRVFHSSFVSFLFAEEGRGVAGVGGGVGWGVGVGFGVMVVGVGARLGV